MKSEKLIDMFKSLFLGKYDPVQFSCDFPEFCFQNYNELEKEHEGLGYYLDQVVPDICDEGEPGFDPTHMIEELKKVYEKVKAFCS
jgi:hypothetical protein